MVLGMADMYESDPAFHVTFGTAAAARYAAEALRRALDTGSARSLNEGDDVA
jgi:hypothetical protein